MQPVEEVGQGVALTFDDGPHPGGTPGVLEALASAAAPAAFFVLGTRILEHGEVLDGVLASGAGVGVHSWEHVDLTGRSVDFLDEQLGRTVEQLSDFGVKPRLFRPPFGFYDAGVLDAADRHDLRTVLWTIDPKDWMPRSASEIVSDVKADLRAGAIVLLHDGGSEDRRPTIIAIEGIVAAVRARGLPIVDLAVELSP